MRIESAQGRDPRIGCVVQGRYRIIERLGAGGMGTVYLAEHTMIGRKVALKTLHAQFATDPEIVLRFHREALAATSIGNEHIVEVTDMGHFDDGTVYMVLEYLEGSDFGVQIDEQGPQSLSRVVRIMLQLCDALVAVHGKGIVHRDLKPDNIFLTRRGDNPDFVKVLDFGISKFRSQLGEHGAGMTATGAALGTPYFMAPEQTQGSPLIDYRADVYALGAVIYFALAGEHPFEATNLPMLFVKICTEAPTPLRELRPDLPEAFEAIVHRALAKDPDHRFNDCQALKEALLPYASMETELPATLVSAAAPRSRLPRILSSEPASRSLIGASTTLLQPQPRRNSLFALVGLAVVASAAGAWFTFRSAPTDPAPAAATSAAPAVERLRVSVTTEPAGAELLLDGKPIANPFDAELPKSERAQVFEARLEGFESVRREITLAFPQSVRLRLNPVAEPARKPAPVAVESPVVVPPPIKSRPGKPSAAALIVPFARPVERTQPAAAPAAPAPLPAATPPTAEKPAPAPASRSLKSPFGT